MLSLEGALQYLRHSQITEDAFIDLTHRTHKKGDRCKIDEWCYYVPMGNIEILLACCIFLAVLLATLAAVVGVLWYTQERRRTRKG